jgi:hypothetical protein
MTKKNAKKIAARRSDDEYTTNKKRLSFEPDWSSTWTPAEAEYQLIDFKFKGSGWYLTNNESMLVVPYGDGEKYVFHIYNNRNPSEEFNWIVNAPSRLDLRMM